MTENNVNTAPVVEGQPPKKKLRKIYDYLVKKKAVKDDYDQFETAMQDDKKFERVHRYLKEQPDTKVSEDFASFKTAILGEKKKEIPLPAPPFNPPAQQPTQQPTQQPAQQVQVQQPTQPVQGLTQQVPLGGTITELEKSLSDPEGSFAKFVAERSKSEEQKRYEEFKQKQDEKQAREYVGRISNPEEYQEQNPLVSLAKKAWQTLRYDLPATIATGATTLGNMATMYGPYAPENEATIEEMKKGKAAVAKWAIGQQAKGQVFSKDLVDTLDKVDDPVDALNWISSAIGQAGVQIPASIATYGTSSFGQEAGGIYLASVQRIAQEKGITPEQVIEQGLDEPGIALAYGTVAGALDFIGAKGVASGFTKQTLGKSLRDRALITLKSGVVVEPTTEYFQTWLEQVGEEQSTGKSFGDAVKFVLTDPQKRQERLEATAQGAITGGAGTVISSSTPKQQTNAVPEPATTEVPVGETPGDSQTMGEGNVQQETTEVQNNQTQAPVEAQPVEQQTAQPQVTETTAPPITPEVPGEQPVVGTAQPAPEVKTEATVEDLSGKTKDIMTRTIPYIDRITNVKVKTVDPVTGQQKEVKMEALKADTMLKKRHKALENLINCLQK